jgi:hypothetical protein
MQRVRSEKQSNASRALIPHIKNGCGPNGWNNNVKGLAPCVRKATRTNRNKPGWRSLPLGGRKFTGWKWRITMFLDRLFHKQYDLVKESEIAGFRRNVDHFRSYLKNCPKYAREMYGQSKYLELRKQIGLPQFDSGNRF